MLKRDRPSEYFLGAILRAYDRAVARGDERVTPSALWDFVCIECMRTRGAFTTMFAWDTSTAQSKNRIGDIADCLERGYVPGLALTHDERGRWAVVPR